MDQNLNFTQAWTIFRKHMIAVFLWAFFLTVCFWGIATFVLTPKYSASTQLLVSRKSGNNASANNGAQFNDQQADIQMITTYKDIITNQVILDKVGQQLKNYNLTTDQLKSSIKISNQQNSQVFAITATVSDPYEAARIANETAQVFKSKIKKIMSVNNVTIVSKAVPNATKISPKIGLISLLGLLLGLIIGVLYAFLRELTDNTVKDEMLLSKSLGLTNLGHISRIPNTARFTNSHSRSRQGTSQYQSSNRV